MTTNAFTQLLKAIKKLLEPLYKHKVEADEKLLVIDEKLDSVDEKIVELDGKASLQRDWNQNDETAPDYVKNRTHYETGGWIQVYPSDDNQIRYSGITWAKNIPCTFRVDGIEYNFSNGLQSGAYYAGGQGYYVGDRYANGWKTNDYGFCFMNFGEPTDELYALFKDNSISHTIEIPIYQVHPLDIKYIPDTIARTTDIPDSYTKEEVDTKLQSVQLTASDDGNGNITLKMS